MHRKLHEECHIDYPSTFCKSNFVLGLSIHPPLYLYADIRRFIVILRHLFSKIRFLNQKTVGEVYITGRSPKIQYIWRFPEIGVPYGTLKSSILMGCSLINHPAMGVPPFTETPIWQWKTSQWVAAFLTALGGMESFAPYASAAEGGPVGTSLGPRSVVFFRGGLGGSPWKMRVRN